MYFGVGNQDDLWVNKEGMLKRIWVHICNLLKKIMKAFGILFMIELRSKA